MVNIYDELRSGNGDLISGRNKLFVKSTNEDGSLREYMSGVSCVPEENGTMFIVDDWIIPQIDKIKFKDGTLSVKDGEELIPPVKSEKQLKIEELQRQMEELQAMPDEPTNTEEQSDAPLLDYTDKSSE